jgi:hypothetical protein
MIKEREEAMKRMRNRKSMFDCPNQTKEIFKLFEDCPEISGNLDRVSDTELVNANIQRNKS